MGNGQSQRHSQSMNSPLQSALTPGKPEHKTPVCSLSQEQELSLPGSCSLLSLKDQIKKVSQRPHLHCSASVGLPLFLPSDEDLSSAKELSQSCQPMNFRCTEIFMAGVVSPLKTCCGTSSGRTQISTTLDEAHWLPGSPSY